MQVVLGLFDVSNGTDNILDSTRSTSSSHTADLASRNPNNDLQIATSTLSDLFRSHLQDTDTCPWYRQTQPQRQHLVERRQVEIDVAVEELDAGEV